MAGRPFLPDLVPCREDSGVQLEQVGGARVDLLQWQSQASNEQVALPVYTDRWLSSNTCGSIEQVVVHVHGKERDADIAWADIAAARGRLSVDQQKKTLLVVPQFLNGLDKSKYQPANQDLLLVWKGNGWGEGSPSVRPKASVSNDNTGISSFEALDAILSHFANRQMYHGVERIVFSGHSMGGQLVHRYSILSSPILPAAKRDLKVEYVVMNAASYLYFSGEREGPPAPNMNEYKYGFDNIATHIPIYPGIQTQQDPHWYLSRMLQERQIHFVNGATDRGTGDDRPEAMAQGADRRERAVNYHRHLKRMEASIGKTGERLWTVDWVPGVKHDGAAMTSSNAAIARIFARIVA